MVATRNEYSSKKSDKLMAIAIELNRKAIAFMMMLNLSILDDFFSNNLPVDRAILLKTSFIKSVS